MATFEGSYRHKIDSKGRLSLPAEFRKELKRDLKLVLSDDAEHPSLMIFEPEEYTQWLDHYFDKKGGYDPSNRQMRNFRKVMASRSKPCQMDEGGRIRLTAEQRERAGLSTDVTIIGDFDHLEVWDTQRWDEFELQALSLDFD